MVLSSSMQAYLSGNLFTDIVHEISHVYLSDPVASTATLRTIDNLVFIVFKLLVAATVSTPVQQLYACGSIYVVMHRLTSFRAKFKPLFYGLVYHERRGN